MTRRALIIYARAKSFVARRAGFGAGTQGFVAGGLLGEVRGVIVAHPSMERTTMKRALMIATLAANAVAPAGGCGEERPGEEEVASKIERRFLGDRSGACVVAAVIEPAAGDAGAELVATQAWRCAGARQQALDGAVAMEIGSISKTMTGMLLGELAAEGILAIDEPLQTYAPAGISVPTFGDGVIRLAHLVTHTSGLPSLPESVAIADPNNPYAQMREAELWRALGEAQLERRPGASWAYSNFAVMLLSSVIAGESGASFEDVVGARIFAPLGMTRSYLKTRPEGVTVAVGHKAGGQVASAWDFGENTGGVGGVRATMDDMIRYAKAQLGEGDAKVVAMARRSHPRVALGEGGGQGQPEMGLGWVRAQLDGRTLLLHDGGTGGFSSILIVDEARRRAVVVLADTQLATVGGVTELGLHLVDEQLPLDGPRLAAVPPAALVDALVGSYVVDGEVAVTLEKRGAALWAVVGEEAMELAYDSHGDFYPRDQRIDGLLTPVRGADGRQTFVWVAQGVPSPAERLQAAR
jgi:serine-type D-Ala-D-Ala carboxypeptidase/endopeptidase